MKTHNIAGLARIIRQDWKSPYFGAIPYLHAMSDLDTLKGSYGIDSAESIVRYFLSNASAWRGPVAREVKAELNRRLEAHTHN